MADILYANFGGTGGYEVTCVECGKDGYLAPKHIDDARQPNTDVVCMDCC